jgi:demethylmenaquinone methyltransferase/2-methoxy-6-polyprenyl-1,4-benzoquinol methylase
VTNERPTATDRDDGPGRSDRTARGEEPAGRDDASPAVGRDGGPLDRGQRLYDRHSEHGLLYGSVMKLAAPLRRKAFEALDVRPGERVLDLACGPGVNFERLGSDVGPDGEVVGLDYSEGMVRRARERVREAGWDNVDVVRADATAPFADPGVFDAAVVTMALHTVADADAVAADVHDALRPGGRFVVLDSRAFQTWPASALNPLFERAIAATANHRPDQDPLGALRATFGAVEVVEEFDLGAGYLAVAHKGDGG